MSWFVKETQISWDCENAEMIYVVRKAHLSKEWKKKIKRDQW